MSATPNVDVFEPLMIERGIATAATDAFTTRVQSVIKVAGVDAARSYVIGSLGAAIAASRVAFGDATVRTLLDAQMELEMPDGPVDSERRH